jgi:hypothetical protein
VQLPEGSGLLVQQVLEGSPAAKAGMRKYDIVLEADGTKLAEVTDLMEAVDRAGGKETALKIVRRGDEREMRVVPELRPQDEELQAPPVNESNEFSIEAMPEEAWQWLERFGGPGGGAFNWRQFRPGIVIEDQDGRLARRMTRRELPENFSMHIEKTDKNPAKIHVRRGNDEWDVTEDNLEALPEDVRPLVEDMLSGSRGNLGLLLRENPRFRLAPRQIQPDDSRINRRMDEMSLRLKELQEAVESLRSQK